MPEEGGPCVLLNINLDGGKKRKKIVIPNVGWINRFKSYFFSEKQKKKKMESAEHMKRDPRIRGKLLEIQFENVPIESKISITMKKYFERLPGFRRLFYFTNNNYALALFETRKETIAAAQCIYDDDVGEKWPLSHVRVRVSLVISTSPPLTRPQKKSWNILAQDPPLVPLPVLLLPVSTPAQQKEELEKMKERRREERRKMTEKIKRMIKEVRRKKREEEKRKKREEKERKKKEEEEERRKREEEERRKRRKRRKRREEKERKKREEEEERRKREEEERRKRRKRRKRREEKERKKREERWVEEDIRRIEDAIRKEKEEERRIEEEERKRRKERRRRMEEVIKREKEESKSVLQLQKYARGKEMKREDKKRKRYLKSPSPEEPPRKKRKTHEEPMSTQYDPNHSFPNWGYPTLNEQQERYDYHHSAVPQYLTPNDRKRRTYQQRQRQYSSYYLSRPLSEYPTYPTYPTYPAVQTNLSIFQPTREDCGASSIKHTMNREDAKSPQVFPKKTLRVIGIDSHMTREKLREICQWHTAPKNIECVEVFFEMNGKEKYGLVKFRTTKHSTEVLEKINKHPFLWGYSLRAEYSFRELS